MKTLILALLAGLPSSPQTPPGMHREPAPEVQPLRQFSWRDPAVGYTFIGPPRWAGVVQAVPLQGAHGVRFVADGKTILTVRSSDDAQAEVREGSGAIALSRRDGRVLTAQVGDGAGPLALTPEEMASAIRWDGDAGGGAAER
ncbi:hypothetical protein P3W24_04265 [Luteibacter sp. PPL201]|jgi:hypothetical protein|uniref:Uncharacterized protein n=1 Tax=Luteibacter sahnii TaxID=3021977 RepID=A0ABT6B7X7_9GAMM|nr:hypothetical protein [Luteibacter sp. PPL193]MDY1547913.1 hypothetical protein [Luteibacter sp. PPL193]